MCQSVNSPFFQLMFTEHSEKIVDRVRLSLTENVISFQPLQGDAAGVNHLHFPADQASGSVKA